MKTLIVVLFGGMLLTSCGPRVSSVSQSTAQDVVSKISYAKDQRTGLCYAMYSTGKVGDYNENTIAITWVPCDRVEAFIGK